MAAISSSGNNGSGSSSVVSTTILGSSISSTLFPSIVELNVGGVHYTTTLSTLTRDPDSLLGQMFTGRSRTPVLRDSKGKYFIDRDGVLFRYTLDFLRNQKLTLPENFHECERLRQEADYFQMKEMRNTLMAVASTAGAASDGTSSSVPSNTTAIAIPDDSASTEQPSLEGSPSLVLPSIPAVVRAPGYITLGYRGTFAFGRDGLADVKFRKLSRILICGRVALCREVFGETLNESRDPDRGATDRYSCRFFLKHTFLEQAFDMLQDAGFHCVASCGSGTASAGTDMKPGMDSEENRWNHYNEFVFVRR